MAAVHEAAPPAHDPYLDLLPPQGVKLTPRHYAYLKISEGCNNRCSFCIIPALRGDLVSRPIGRRAARGREAGQGRRQGNPGHLAGHQRLRRRHQIPDEPVRKEREVRAKFLDLARELGELGIWMRMHYVYPYPHVDEVIPLMAEGKILPYLDIPFQHASPPVLKNMRRPAHRRKDAGAHPRAGARSAPTSPSARPSSSAFPARPKRISRCCSTGSTKPGSTAPAASNTSRSGARAPTTSASSRCRRRSRRRAGTASWQRQQKISAAAAAEEGRQAPARASSTRRTAPRPRAAPNTTRRRSTARPHPVAPAAARRRDRHRQDRPRRRLRSLRHGGLSECRRAGLRFCRADRADVRRFTTFRDSAPPLTPSAPAPAMVTKP